MPTSPITTCKAAMERQCKSLCHIKTWQHKIYGYNTNITYWSHYSLSETNLGDINTEFLLVTAHFDLWDCFPDASQVPVSELWHLFYLERSVPDHLASPVSNYLWRLRKHKCPGAVLIRKVLMHVRNGYKTRTDFPFTTEMYLDTAIYITYYTFSL